MPPSRQMLTGAVSFLDVLGWKGIWLRHEPKEVVRLLEDLVRLAMSTAEAQRGKSDAASTRVLSISDTIVLLTEGLAEDVVPIHGLICKTLLPESVRRGIPLRGATSYGEFSASEGTILIGPAVDEAASWHEGLDWIGVILTPAAEYKHDPADPWIKYNKAPVKGLGSRALWCVDWSTAWADESEIKKLFAEAGPMDTTVAAKYMNSFDFLRERLASRKAAQT